MENILPVIQQYATFYGIKIIAALVILIVGRWIAGLMRRIVKKILTKRNLDPTIVSFVASITYVTLMVFVIIAVLARVGIQTASFVAILGAAGLAIGFALQGSLSNFAAGFLIIVFKPYRAGDYVEAGGTAGIVEEVRMFTTRMRTPDNKIVIVPNSKVTGDNIVNYSAKETRRIDLKFGVSYSDDLHKVKQILLDIVNNDSRILKDPAPQVAVLELADSSINFVCRPWVNTADYWDVYFDTTEAVKKRFDQEGISIPFPQTDVHLYKHE